MSPISSKKTARRLVLDRETVRALTGPRNSTMVDETLDARATSCGVDCGCTAAFQAR